MTDVLFFDFETEVDWSLETRFGLPEVMDRSKLQKPGALVEGTVAEIKAYVKSLDPLAIPLYWPYELQAAEEAGQHRSGVLELIEPLKGAREIAAGKFALDPELCTIASMAWAVNDEPVQKALGRGGNEKKLLETFWDMVSPWWVTLVGFNAISFDVPVAIARAIQLGVNVTRVIDRRPFGNKDVIDIMMRRFGREKPVGQKALAIKYGIEVPAGDVDGSMVPLLSDDELLDYNASDVTILRELFHKFNGAFFDRIEYGGDDVPF